MVFNSIAFLTFFLIFYSTYWLVASRCSVNWSNGLLIIGSYIFYGWWDWRFLGLILISSASDYILGLQIGKARSRSRKKSLLLLSLAINLGILGFFKYFNFFIESLHSFMGMLGLGLNSYTLNIILPVGISFYTFQTMSYTIDIYREELKPTKSILQFFAFVSFFPQLVAGPIERAARFLPQFKIRKIFSRAQSTAGLRLILWGFFKKIVIADNLALMVEEIFAHPGQHTGLGIFVGAMLFAFQIYCDFSGYSDIAIGLGKTLGFELMTNFRTPYFSGSFAEFWKRWHISLSTWFRDYVYIPLGGNRVGKGRNRFNLMVTFVISGLWHGANLTFIIWGLAHGLMLVLEKNVRFIKQAPALVVFSIVSIFWLPFRAESTSHLQTLLRAMVNFRGPNFWGNLMLYSNSRMIALATTAALFFILEKRMGQRNISQMLNGFGKPLRIALYTVLLFSILLLGNFDVKPYFIYFQF